MMMMMMMMMMIMNRKSKKTTQKSNFEMILKILVYHRLVQVVLPLAKQCLGLCDRDGFRWVLEILSPWKTHCDEILFSNDDDVVLRANKGKYSRHSLCNPCRDQHKGIFRRSDGTRQTPWSGEAYHFCDFKIPATFNTRQSSSSCNNGCMVEITLCS